jgi:hypothetical protein
MASDHAGYPLRIVFFGSAGLDRAKSHGITDTVGCTSPPKGLFQP